MQPSTNPRLKHTASRKVMLLTDGLLSSWREFEIRGLISDSEVKGLRVRIGVHRTSFWFFQEHSIKGDRSTTCEKLGEFPSLDVNAARAAARVVAGRNASGRIAPGKRSAAKLSRTLANYIRHLKARAWKRGKPRTWAWNALGIARKHIMPQFGKWSLIELSANPAAVAQWHKDVTAKSGPVAGNHAAKILRATYKRAARLDRTLPPHNPCSAVEFNAESRSQKALPFADFPKWKRAWEQIESPTRRAFQMINLLTGARPGELSRLKWSDVMPKERCFVIRGAKAQSASFAA